MTRDDSGILSIRNKPTGFVQKEYTSDFIEKCYILWYNSGKPNFSKLKDYLVMELNKPDGDWGETDPPTSSQLRSWSKLYNWFDRATEADLEVAKQIDQQLVVEKVEMLKRHAEIGRGLQKMAIDYLETHDLGSARTALQALVEGLRVEKDSVGIIPYFEKLEDASDEKLLDDLKKLISSSPVVSEEAYEEPKDIS